MGTRLLRADSGKPVPHLLSAHLSLTCILTDVCQKTLILILFLFEKIFSSPERVCHFLKLSLFGFPCVVTSVMCL